MDPWREFVRQCFANRRMRRDITFMLSMAIFMLAPCLVVAQSVDRPSRCGPENLPHQVEPIDAAFDMPKFERPSFGEQRVSITEHGATPNGELVTGAIQRAIDSVSDRGGGTVVVPNGEFLTGRLQLKTNVNLHLQAGATLRFSGALKDYLPAVFCRWEGLEVMSLGALIYARNAENIAVTGEGKLLGPTEGRVRQQMPGLTDDIVDASTPVATRLFDGQDGRRFFRPYFIAPIHCRRVWIEGVSLARGPMWNIVPIYCEHVVIRGVRVNSDGVTNGDGINIESSRNVLVEYCSVQTGDDCYCLKAGRNEDGLRVGRATENVVIRYSHASGGFGGITAGSETAGMIRNIYAHDCHFENVYHALYLKTRRPRAGGGENIHLNRISFNSSRHAIFVDMLGTSQFVGRFADRSFEVAATATTPRYGQIHISHISGRADGELMKVKGLPESPLRDLTIENAKIQSAGLLNLSDARGVRLKNVDVMSTEPLIQLRDCAEVVFDHVRFNGSNKKLGLTLSGVSTNGIRFIDCEPKLTRDDLELNIGDGIETSEPRFD